MISRHKLPALDLEQMLAIYRCMVDEMAVWLVQMMETAGLNLARLARERFLEGDTSGKEIVVLAGKGNNGGAALAAARHLHNWGARVQAQLTNPVAQYSGVPGRQVESLLSMGVETQVGLPFPAPGDCRLIIEGLIGYSLKGSPRGNPATLINWANEQPQPVLSLDLPSGIDPTKGVSRPPIVEASATMTIGLPKKGLLVNGASRYVGELYLSDIGIPLSVYERLGIHGVPRKLFSKDSLIRLDD